MPSQRLSQAKADSPEAAKAKLDIAVAEGQVEVLRKTQNELNAELDRAAEKAKDNQASAESHMLAADVYQQEAFVSEIKTRLEQFDIELRMPPRVTVLEKAN